MGNLFAVGGSIVLVLMYLLVLAVVGLALYFVVRTAVLHALKAHTRWVDRGKPGG